MKTYNANVFFPGSLGSVNCEVILVDDYAQREPFAWYTDDYLSDKSSTTYDLETAKRWLAKGWKVQPLFI